MSKVGLFLFLVGSLFIFIGVSEPAKEVKSSSQVQTELQTPSPSVQAFVTRVVDGDTVDIEINGKRDIVRLIGINAPEKNECFGKEATEKALSILSSKSINLESDPTQGDRDIYQRLLRYVFINGVNFDELMIREGFAKEYTYKISYKYQLPFEMAEKDAQQNNRGLWSFCR